MSNPLTDSLDYLHSKNPPQALSDRTRKGRNYDTCRRFRNYPVSRLFLDKVFERFPKIAENDGYRNTLWYLFFGTEFDTDSGNLLLCRKTLATPNNKALHELTPPAKTILHS